MRIGCKIVNNTLLRGNGLHLKLIASIVKYRIEYYNLNFLKLLKAKVIITRIRGGIVE